MTVTQAAWKMKDREGFREKLAWVGLKARSSISHLMKNTRVIGPPTRLKGSSVPDHLRCCGLAPSTGTHPEMPPGTAPSSPGEGQPPVQGKTTARSLFTPTPESQQSMPTGLEPP